MRQQITNFLTKYNIPRSDRFLIAISGGMDSVVLTHLMKAEGLDIGLAHFNYQLRGEDSNKDEQFVKQLADNWNIPIHLTTADTKTRATKQKKGIQELARDLRYNWFQEIAQKTPYQWIVTAHHLNDSVETTLLNLTKGTGLKGLRGIPPVNKNILRPLSQCTRAEIQYYLTENQLTYRLDTSNEKTDYQRNRIRLEVIPPLKSINPSLEKTFLSNFKHAQGYLSIVNAYLLGIVDKLVRVQGNTLYIDGTGLLQTPAPETVLFELVNEEGFNSAQVTDIVKAIPRTEEAVFLSNTHQITVSRSQIIFAPKTKESKDLTIEITELPVTLKAGNITITANKIQASKTLSYGPMTALLDADKVQLPLKIRNWQQGDRFQPFGMNGKSKKISDCFTDWKLNSIQKKELLIVESNGQICWVVGHRIDHRFAAKPISMEVIKLTAT